MGNLCSSERDPFSQPGRPLGTTPTTPASASVPASARSPRTVGGPPRTLGGGPGPGPTSPGRDADDPRARAAAAAEARLQESQKRKGKLQAQLDKQRRMTDPKVLQEASKTERGQRALDESVDALAHS
ncbi:hypothetical protein MYCTH_2296764 [Thermothelomyces thermophilus ATCC 42464]|uniref:Uncharacterized protein n=1 Tax=Thermothelomyces thermophilus (strain ATCC 42464 / BCRC 31852 / DSM 1799) TaxID=573729 RepID=G2Q2U4_THET4|nr:uncharacterized protein MYCTH_2296764 [Thermothelomyces thermophilus ATCC 42464]AEO54311.1 hypothetical protein MYCTH_2296764 [Thermothelomyces thermophilus ATCC 42464]